jgi:peptide/nickel transport system permease protein
MTETTIVPAAKTASLPKRRGIWGTLVQRLLREKPLGTIGLVIVAILALAGIFANFIAPQKAVGASPGYNILHLADRLSPPSATYPLGTDHLGRDVLSRIIYGARLSMIVGLIATAINTVISAGIGITSAILGGTFDLLVQRIVDAWVCFPTLIVLITLMAIIGPGLVQLLLVLGINGGVGGIRFARSLGYAIKENQYIHASSAIGARRGRVIFNHVLPNVMPMLIVLFTLGVGGNIMAEASLSFLGLGLPPPYPSWGAMISAEGRANQLRAPWLAFFPGLALTLAVFGINMLGDALRDLLDPRLRGGLGSYRIKDMEKFRRKHLKEMGAKS